ncbi:hypothetical protein W04_0287 [Pseudoalteromonas sp. SW0106-04]|nr:hypothetical protein W04_0287 [Pseudoalteromonas sp. SW0106-04]
MIFLLLLYHYRLARYFPLAEELVLRWAHYRHCHSPQVLLKQGQRMLF